jgi:hypothetical protein
MAKAPKLPKLLAAIRANRARVEKEAKLPRGAEPGPGPHGVVTAVTPDIVAVPNNYVARGLDECTSVEHCNELLAHAKQHGYSEEGQTVTLIRSKLAGLKQGTHHAELTSEALHAASKWGRRMPTPQPKATKRGRR